MVNPRFEPTEKEDRVLSVLQEENRANPYLLRQETGLGKGDVNTALTRLTSAGWVRKVTRGLYEFVEDPRDDQEDDADSSPGAVAASGRDQEEPPDVEEEPGGSGDESPPQQDEPGIDALVDEVADEELPGSGEKLEARREALHAVVEYLRDHGVATPKDFQRDVYPEHTGFYTGGSDPPYSWWTNAMYSGMSELAERTDKIGAADSTGEWTWHGGKDE